MDYGAGLGCRTTGSGPGRLPCLLGCCRSALLAEISGLCSGCDCRLAVVHPCALVRIGARALCMFRLSCDCRNMPLACRSLLVRGWTRLNPALSAVVTDAVPVVVLDPFVVDIVNIRDIHVVDGTVIEKVPVVPTAASITLAKVNEAVVDHAIEPDGRPPVAVIEEITAVAPAPIARSPEETFFRRHHPRSGHPVVIRNVVVIGPIARRPEIAISEI